MNGFLSELVNVERVSNAVAAGTTAVNSDGVQLGGGDSVMFIVAMGTVTVAPTIKAQQSDDNGSTDDWGDLADSNIDTIVDGDDNLLVVVDIRRPQKAYVRLVMTRTAGNVVVDGIVALVYDSKERPVTQSADVAETLRLLAPSEGTA